MLLCRTTLLTDGRASNKALVALLTRLMADVSVVAGDTLDVGVSEYSNVVASGVGIHGPCILVM